MDAGQLDVLHHSRYEYVLSIRNGIGFAFGCVVQESVDQDRAIRCDADGCLHVAFHLLVIVYDFHATPAQYEGRTYHDGVSDPGRDLFRFLHGYCHPCLRHGNLQFLHHGAEQVAVFGHVNGLRRGTKDLYAIFLQVCSKIERRLSAKLRDDANRLLFVVNGQNVFQCQRLEVELV